MKTILAVLALATLAIAADDAKPAPQPPVPEVTRLRLVASFQKARMAQNDLNTAMQVACAKDPDCQKAQTKFNADVTDLQATYQQAKADLKLPADEELAIDANAKAENQVQIRKITPPAKP